MKKIIVITGAAGGVGSLLAKGLAKKGHHIVCVGRSEAGVKKLADTINANIKEGSASIALADMSEPKQVDECAKTISKEFDGFDVWINNVGVNNHNAIGPSWELEPQNWWTEVNLNLYTAYLGTRAAISCMKDKNKGYIINLGGGGVQEPKPFGSAYGAAKSAIVKFTETVSIELAQEKINIKAFSFNPGFIKNDRTEILVESKVCKKYMPKLEAVLKYGVMSNAQDSVDLINTIISGSADALAGKYFFADDKNIEEAIANSKAFVREEKNLLRVK
ncbi:short-subunit dehydrogenase [Wenyingzhuangia heitensis]|uniref:Short-subunit dehydrogenase n=1 Tax=Wenyingzhuangia heitensis TaxID=1487859 RepID=A0ABX0U7P8_9FLAO|nr:SDR family oxidoreductase [Wenyingzhuangia heitensis]NIJ44864.1 short-subunit dehydrogenase [Wenyingzhuangia heitensis]